MTEKEIQEQNNRAEQDIITLDYTKWSFQQRRLKRSDDHNLWQQERDCVIDRQRSDNAKARAGYLQDLEDKKRAKQRADEAETLSRSGRRHDPALLPYRYPPPASDGQPSVPARRPVGLSVCHDGWL